MKDGLVGDRDARRMVRAAQRVAASMKDGLVGDRDCPGANGRFTSTMPRRRTVSLETATVDVSGVEVRLDASMKDGLVGDRDQVGAAAQPAYAPASMKDGLVGDRDWVSILCGSACGNVGVVRRLFGRLGGW